MRLDAGGRQLPVGADGCPSPIERIFREESGRVIATLIRRLGDFEMAEEAVQEAFTAALEQWPREGIPANPRAWLVAAGRNRAIDRMRRYVRLLAIRQELQSQAEIEAQLQHWVG